MSKQLLPLILIMLLSVSAVAVESDSDATTAALPNAPATATAESRLDYGFDVRVRSENWNNIQDQNDASDDERHHVRFRTRTWMKVNTGRVDLYVRLANEFRKQTTPELRLNLDEVFVDSLYLDFKKLPLSGLTLRVGRQELAPKGDGLLFSDASSCDGSRSFYYNALDLTYSRKKSKLELLAILDPRQEQFLPLIHNQSKYLNEWDEQAIGLYYTDRNHKLSDLDAYYFYKKEVHDYRAAVNRSFQPDRHVQTAGIRVLRRLPRSFTMTSELAYQWGAQHPEIRIRGWAATTWIKKEWTARWKPYVLAAFVGLSGDDRKTAGVEGWDPIFSRYPRWSDLYVYSLVPEGGQAYWSNLKMWEAEAGMAPATRVSLKASLIRLGSWQSTVPTSTFGSGTLRGTTVAVRADLLLARGVKAHLQYERLDPGDFYRHDFPGYFMRAEISYEWKRNWGRRATK